MSEKKTSLNPSLKPEEPQGLKEQVKAWIKDFIDVIVTLGVILIILRVLLGAQMIVPLVVITTGSMVHHAGDYSWMEWLNSHGIAYERISEMPLGNGFNVGDMMVTMRPDVKLGDVIIYERDFVYGKAGMEPIIHRVVGIVQVNNNTVAGFEGTLDCFKEEDFSTFIQYVEDCRSRQKECNYPKVPETDPYRFYITKGDANSASDQCATYGNTPMRIALPVNEAQVPAKAWLRLPYIGWLKLILNALIRLLTLRF